MNSNSIEQKIEKILADHKVRSAPVPVKKIARAYDIAIGTTASDKFSGVLLRKEDGTSFIAVNDDEPQTRQRFTIAHELGHYFLHTDEQTFIDFYRDNDSQVIRSPKERQANQFAAALLMPKKILQKDVEIIVNKDGSVTEEHVAFLARKYKVSEPAMNYRLINLNLS